MSDEQINKAMELGWEKAMKGDDSAVAGILSLEEYQWLMFGWNLGLTTKELKGEQPTPSIITDFSEEELKWFQGGKA